MIDGLKPYSEYKESGLPTPTALRREAQGCEERATLGGRAFGFSQPQRGCGMGGHAKGRNPVGVVFVLGALPKVAPRRRNLGLEDGIPLGFSSPQFSTEARHD